MKYLKIFLFFIAFCMPFSVYAEQGGADSVDIGGYEGLSTKIDEEDLTYRLGSRDLLKIEIYQVEELNHLARINTEGYISMPLIGNLKVIDLTVQETERLIEKKLGTEYLQDPHVTVFVEEYESQKITVEGFVKNPGVYSLTGKTTLLQAIAMADGALRLADQKKIVVFRSVGKDKVVGYKINIKKIRTGEIKDPYVQNKDIIVVPKHGGRGVIDEIQRTISGFTGFI